jgi:predicted XRE-type DNA-binding protein
MQHGLVKLSLFCVRFKNGLIGRDCFYTNEKEMRNMFGVGKSRTKFGKWLDREGLTQREIENESGLGRATISKLCNDKHYRPKIETISKVKRAVRNLGRDVPPDNHFGM